MSREINTKGFTIIELTLAMGFVSALLLAIAMTVIQISHIYNRGITYKNVNQSGSLLIKEIQNSINGSEPFSVSGTGSSYVDKEWGGRLCTGQYSYVWNYGLPIFNKIELNDPVELNEYRAPNSDIIIRFIKVYDPGSTYCFEILGSYPDIDINNAVEMLDPGQHDLVIHDFNIVSDPSVYDGNTNQQLYNIEFYLGTNNQDALKLDSGKTVCKNPSEEGADPAYCSVSKFKIVARAGNSVE